MPAGGEASGEGVAWSEVGVGLDESDGGEPLQQRVGEQLEGEEEERRGELREDGARERLLQHRQQDDWNRRCVVKGAGGHRAEPKVAGRPQDDEQQEPTEARGRVTERRERRRRRGRGCPSSVPSRR